MDNIKVFEEKYLKECSKIYPKIFNMVPWNEKWTQKTAYLRLKEIYDTPNFIGIVYIQNKKIIGAILGNLETWDLGLKYILKEFFIDVKVQKSGIGSKMIKFLEEKLRETRVESIELYTLKGKATEGFYKKNGYIIQDNTVIMERFMD